MKEIGRRKRLRTTRLALAAAAGFLSLSASAAELVNRPAQAEGAARPVVERPGQTVLPIPDLAAPGAVSLAPAGALGIDALSKTEAAVGTIGQAPRAQAESSAATGGGQALRLPESSLDAVGASAAYEKAADVEAQPSASEPGARPGDAPRVDFLNADGPIHKIRYSPAEAPGLLDRLYTGAKRLTDFGGRTPVHVLFGGGNNSYFNRPWIARYTKAADEEAAAGEVPGLKLLVVDREGQLPPAGDTHFSMVGDLKDPSPENRLSLAQSVLRWAEQNNAVIMGANSILNPYIVFPPVLQALARDSGHNPAIPVNPIEAVEAARVKSTTRKLVAQHAPWLALPARVIESPSDASARDAAEHALQIFEEMQAQNPGRRFVLKPEQSAGKVGIRFGIGSAEQFRAAYRSIEEELGFWKENPEDAALHTLTAAPRLILERQIEAHGEYDIEMILRPLEDGAIEAVAFVIGNPRPEPSSGAELGMTFPAMLSETLTKQLITAALDSVVALWRAAAPGALPFGNFHVEMMLEDGTTPQLVEINATRPVGGDVVPPAIKKWSGLDVARQGARAALGLPLELPAEQPRDAMSIRKITPAHTGTLAEVVVPEGVRDTPGLEDLSIRAKIGGELFAPQDNKNGFSSIGYVTTRGGTQEEATATAFHVMNRITVKTNTPGGLAEQKGDAYHSTDDEIRLPRPTK